MPDLPSAGPVPAPSTWRGRVDDLADRIGVEPLRLLLGVAVALIVVIVVLVVMGGGGVSGAQASSPSPSSSPFPSSLPLASVTTTTSATECWVDVTGAVIHPGVYRLPAGARANDAVAMAGGAAADGQLESINLAARVTDGQRLYVPRRGEPPAAAAVDDPGPAPVDLNSATLEQLDTLPGVGPATARAIVDWRGQHGRFRSVDDLLHIRGLGRARVDALRSRVVVQ